ncbi:hypothetical protein [Leptothoe sp. PORK10 BA2]|uniref:hypothetical protein n=1 Tax=Leptothoe sp. PORK10 BA2 TaxID=3110254 RepID=UPI002B1EF2AC|nr:hypothetical protein [Leptothoe sp. PORK10 BA2]MEA5464071.1 hypothetical protein [Leptothoe sp. PORK10 BA2]
MQAQELFSQVQKLALTEQLTLLNFLVQLIQQEVVPTPSPQQTVLERMGGLPQHILSVGGLSDRDTRRQRICDRIQARHQA